MDVQDMEIGLSGFGIGPFPDQNRIRPLISKWRLLPLAKKLGFDQEEIAAYLETFFGLFSGVSVHDFADTITHFLPFIRARALAVVETSSNTSNKDKNKEDRSVLGERTNEEKAADVLALFSAVYAYISSVDRIGQDKANDFSCEVYSQLVILPSELLLSTSAFVSKVREDSSSQFIKRLYQYPNGQNDVDDTLLRHVPVLIAHLCMGNPGPLRELLRRLSMVKDNAANSFSSAIVFMPKEQKSLSLIDFFSGLLNQSIKPQAFTVTVPDMQRKSKKLSRPDLHDPGSYLEALMVSVLVGRKDFITKGVNLNIAQEEGLGIMDSNYAIIGGEQGFGESLAQDYLDKRSVGILKASLLDGEAFMKAGEALDTLKTMMSRFKNESTQELKEVQKLDKLTKPVSLDTEVEVDEGGTSSLFECIQAEQDPLEALGRYYEAVSKLPKEMQLIFRRVLEEGETPKQAAMSLGYEWTSAVERKVERMKKKIYEEMLN
jgi:hypothetical protein